MPPSGVKNSYKYLPDVGQVIVLEEPSPPLTPPETITAVGIVIVCDVDANVISNIILPSDVVAGQFLNDNVFEALDVIVW